MVLSRWEKLWSRQRMKKLTPRTKECVFHSEYVAFIKLLNYQSQSVPTRNKQVMKTKLHTFAR